VEDLQATETLMILRTIFQHLAYLDKNKFAQKHDQDPLELDLTRII
jgi:hypothetical protein